MFIFAGASKFTADTGDIEGAAILSKASLYTSVLAICLTLAAIGIFCIVIFAIKDDISCKPYEEMGLTKCN